MKKLFFQVVVILMPAFAFAQIDTSIVVPTTDTSYWKKGTTLNINVTQVSLTNWSAGGQSSIAWTALSNTFANYEKGNTTWENTLNMSYGMTKIAARDFRKTDDRFYFLTKLSHKKTEKLKYTLYFDFLTQFTNGYAYLPSVANPGQDSAVLQSQFMSRGFSMLALGMEYSPVKPLSIFFSPITAKTTIVGNQVFANRGDFGVRPEYIDAGGNRVAGKNFLIEPGALLNIAYKQEIMQNITLQSNVNLFWAYVRKDYVNDTYMFYKNVDVQWDLALLMKVNKLINVSLGTSMIYDDDIKVLRTDGTTGAALQFKQVLALGITGTLKNKNAKADDLKK